MYHPAVLPTPYPESPGGDYPAIKSLLPGDAYPVVTYPGTITYPEMLNRQKASYPAPPSPERLPGDARQWYLPGHESRPRTR